MLSNDGDNIKNLEPMKQASTLSLVRKMNQMGDMGVSFRNAGTSGTCRRQNKKKLMKVVTPLATEEKIRIEIMRAKIKSSME
jgi:hypothetical protein